MFIQYFEYVVGWELKWILGWVGFRLSSSKTTSTSLSSIFNLDLKSGLLSAAESCCIVLLVESALVSMENVVETMKKIHMEINFTPE